MASINKWICSGRLNSDAIAFDTEGQGFECMFHVTVGAGNGGTVWITTYWRGKKAEAAFDDLRKGTLVFVEGSIGPRDADRDGSIIVNAASVIFEEHDGLQSIETLERSK